MSSICSLAEGIKDREAKGLLPPLVPLRKGSGTLVMSLDLPAPVSSSLHLLFPFSPAGRLRLLLKSNSNVTSLDKSSSFLKQAKVLLGLFLSLLLKDQAAYMVDCVLLEDRSRVYSPMHLPWFPKKGINERLLLSLKEFS